MAEIAKIGTPLHGYRTWHVADVYSNGAPFKYKNPDIIIYSVGDWHGGWVIFSLTGMVVRGRLGRMRIFRTAQGAARAAEKLYAERIENVRFVNEAQRASESRA